MLNIQFIIQDEQKDNQSNELCIKQPGILRKMYLPSALTIVTGTTLFKQDYCSVLRKSVLFNANNVYMVLENSM